MHSLKSENRSGRLEIDRYVHCLEYQSSDVNQNVTLVDAFHIHYSMPQTTKRDLSISKNSIDFLIAHPL